MKLGFLMAALFIAPLMGKEMALPTSLKPEALKEFPDLPEARQKLIQQALTVAEENKTLRYRFGGAKPTAGGFDCSGAMYFVLRNSGMKPPSTSAQQFVWLRDAKKITKVKRSVRKVTNEVFEGLKPGDLLFWSGTYQPTDGRKVKITHVGMCLGTEKKDGRPVMICATKGRSYRGVQRDGLGVYDSKIPLAKSRSQFEGLGSPIGLDEKDGATE
ncbi:C40 family peptidase [Akkermansiaceae bacterium]|nr:C40 family peptidase [Akkermansiaceae bacterium]MDB4332302.1 C40 family peptidase [Akkermansiaceae bacterium]MDC0275173.1 C40 family peptidase [Akkermansiaceae bacterium]